MLGQNILFFKTIKDKIFWRKFRHCEAANSTQVNSTQKLEGQGWEGCFTSFQKIGHPVEHWENDFHCKTNQKKNITWVGLPQRATVWAAPCWIMAITLEDFETKGIILNYWSLIECALSGFEFICIPSPHSFFLNESVHPMSIMALYFENT